MSHEALRREIQWHQEYRADWDAAPHEYVDGGIVQWGKSRRLGLLLLGNFKAYLGVQHIDPSKPGWGIVEEPEARFFLSLFIRRQCVALNTFTTMEAALDRLEDILVQHT